MLSTNILPFLSPEVVSVQSEVLFRLLKDLRADKENALKGTREPGCDLPDHLLSDPRKAHDHPVRPREGGTNFWDEGSRRWIMAALSTTMDQTYEEMHFLVLKFFTLSSTRARRLVEAFPVLRAFVWTEYLRVCCSEIQRAECLELLAFDHDSFYKEGATHDRDPTRPLSPDKPGPRFSPRGKPSTSASTSSSSDTDSSTEDEALPVSQSRVPAAARIPKKPKQGAAPFGRSVLRDPPADPVLVPRDLPGDARPAPPLGVKSVLRDPLGALQRAPPPVDKSVLRDPLVDPTARRESVLRDPLVESTALRGPFSRQTPVPTDPSPLGLGLGVYNAGLLEAADRLLNAADRQKGTGSGCVVPPAASVPAAPSSFSMYSAVLDREVAAIRAAAIAAADAKDRESMLLAEIDKLRKELSLNLNPEAFSAPLPWDPLPWDPLPSSSSSSSSRLSSSSSSSSETCKAPPPNSGSSSRSHLSSSSSSGTSHPPRQGRATAPTPPFHTHTHFTQ